LSVKAKYQAGINLGEGTKNKRWGYNRGAGILKIKGPGLQPSMRKTFCGIKSKN